MLNLFDKKDYQKKKKIKKIFKANQKQNEESEDELNEAKFRYLNQFMYENDSKNALEYFQQNA
jgi:hypothetical protein